MATVTNVATTGDSTPGATSQATASLTPTNGNSYLVVVYTTRGSSLNPDSVTMTGWSQTWTELTNLSLLHISTGTTRRRAQWFKTVVSGSPSAGALTFSYTNTPDTIDWAVIDLGPTGSNVIVDGSEKRSTAGATATGGTLWEPVTMNAVANSANRWVAYAAVNVNDTTWRLELDADTNGDADWVTVGSFGSSSTRTRDICWGWIDSTADSTPGVMGSLTGSAYLAAVEIDYNLTVDGTATPSTIALTASTPAPTAAGSSATTPAAVTLTASTPSATVTASASTTPTAIALTVTTPTATPAASSVTTPAAVTLSTTTPAATTSGGAGATPASVNLTATAPAPTATGTATTTPTAVALTATLPTPTGTGAATTTPSSVTLAATVPAPTATGGGAADGTATPATIALTVTTTTPTASASAVATATSVTLTVSPPTSTSTGAATTQPAAVTLTAATASPTATGGATTTPATITTAAATPDPTLAASATVTPTAVTLTVVTPDVTTDIVVAAILGPTSRHQEPSPATYRHPRPERHQQPPPATSRHPRPPRWRPSR